MFKDLYCPQYCFNDIVYIYGNTSIIYTMEEPFTSSLLWAFIQESREIYIHKQTTIREIHIKVALKL